MKSVQNIQKNGFLYKENWGFFNHFGMVFGPVPVHKPKGFWILSDSRSEGGPRPDPPVSGGGLDPQVFPSIPAQVLLLGPLLETSNEV